MTDIGAIKMNRIHYLQEANSLDREPITSDNPFRISVINRWGRKHTYGDCYLF